MTLFAVFLVSFCADFMATVQTIYIAEGSWKAVIWAGLTKALQFGIIILAITIPERMELFLPVVAGDMAGTGIGIWFVRRRS